MTELIWEGKYDKNGNKVAPLRVKLPFQAVETVNETTKERNLALDMFSTGRSPEWRNRLIWGDKKYALPALLEEFAGKVDLIYIDPPFFTGTDQTFTIPIAETDEYIVKEPSLVERVAYNNVLRQQSDSFCSWIYETLLLLRELLNDEGTIYIRFDQYWSHYVKVIADEIFSKQNFQNEMWSRVFRLIRQCYPSLIFLMVWRVKCRTVLTTHCIIV